VNNLNVLLLPAIIGTALIGARPAQAPAKIVPGADPSRDVIPVTQRMLPDMPIRLGGVFTKGLAAVGNVPVSTAAGKLSQENRDWIAANCDVIALSPTDIDRDTFPSIVKAQKLFTPLLYLYASSLYDTPHRGSVGLWREDMHNWALRRKDGTEVPYPERGGHWMDFASPDWAAFWSGRLNTLTQEYGAYGTVAAELPLGNTFVGSDLLKYHSPADRAAATMSWLTAVRKGYHNLIVPSAIGFDLAAGHHTPKLHTGLAAPALEPRLWNDFFPLTDGGWCEGWVQPYWDRLPLSESLWETQMEAADRAGILGQVFIAGAAYRNDRELEFALASYLLIEHNQGRVVFQPMPVRPGEPQDAGFSLATLRREVEQKPQFFRVRLGRGMQERHQIPALGGPVWRRNFQFGDVYVNSSETKTVSVLFAGNMRRVTGAIVRRVELHPHSGAILLYTVDQRVRPAAK
jgi:hypothetical protein